MKKIFWDVCGRCFYFQTQQYKRTKAYMHRYVLKAKHVDIRFDWGRTTNDFGFIYVFHYSTPQVPPPPLLLPTVPTIFNYGIYFI